MSIFAATETRVQQATAESINRSIQEKTEANIYRLAGEGIDAINRRLIELDEEWDIERCLETGAASFTVVGSLLGYSYDRRWFILPALVGGFLLQHALQGWCPPLPVFRSLGIRTEAEIHFERYALKYLRGDFDTAGESEYIDAASAVDAVSK